MLRGKACYVFFQKINKRFSTHMQERQLTLLGTRVVFRPVRTAEVLIQAMEEGRTVLLPSGPQGMDPKAQMVLNLCSSVSLDHFLLHQATHSPLGTPAM